MAGCVLVHGIRISKSCPRVDTINRSVRDVSTLSNFLTIFVCIILEEVYTKCTEKKNESVRNLSTKTCNRNIIVPSVFLNIYPCLLNINKIDTSLPKTNCHFRVFKRVKTVDLIC